MEKKVIYEAKSETIEGCRTMLVELSQLFKNHYSELIAADPISDMLPHWNLEILYWETFSEAIQQYNFKSLEEGNEMCTQHWTAAVALALGKS